MKSSILLAALCLGILVGLSLFSGNANTGAVVTCFVENEPCVCDATVCHCGNETVDVKYCTQTLNTARDK